MKNVSVEEIISKPLSSTIIICKEIEKKGKTGIEIKLKAGYTNPELADGIELCSFKQRRTTPLNQEEMIELSKTNPRLFYEKLTLSQFNDSYITQEKSGSNHIFPSRYQRFYDKCVLFESESYRLYFTDLSIQYFSGLINKLKSRRTDDSLKYSCDMINNGVASNIKFTLFDGFSFKRSNNCYFDANEDGYHFSDPKNTLYYNIDLDENGNFNKQDLENMKKILELFSEKNMGLHYFEWNSTDLVSYGNKGGIILIDGYDKHPELLKHVLSLKRE